jgi:hypothetical protein
MTITLVIKGNILLQPACFRRGKIGVHENTVGPGAAQGRFVFQELA